MLLDDKYEYGHGTHWRIFPLVSARQKEYLATMAEYRISYLSLIRHISIRRLLSMLH